MKLMVFCVRDIRADVFGTPFFLQSVGVAERQFADEINRASDDNVMFKHPEDFELYHFGTFDAISGVFVLLEKPLQVSEGRAALRRKPSDKNQMSLVS